MMTYTTEAIQEFLARTSPFNQLSPAVLEKLSGQFQLLRYRMGQAILVREIMPTRISILYEGQARSLGYDPRTQMPVMLQLLKPGEILGWVGLVRGIPCETAMASIETTCLTLLAAKFLVLLEQEPVVLKRTG